MRRLRSCLQCDVHARKSTRRTAVTATRAQRRCCSSAVCNTVGKSVSNTHSPTHSHASTHTHTPTHTQSPPRNLDAQWVKPPPKQTSHLRCCWLLRFVPRSCATIAFFVVGAAAWSASAVAAAASAPRLAEGAVGPLSNLRATACDSRSSRYSFASSSYSSAYSFCVWGLSGRGGVFCVC